ncbi:MarR family winged helix-turn-helix transcriptional regulator [Paenibacillus koleovorans]|uniref:MarR family winged helix-turn-helix transcriptional regulator n=1 Tax=Paenibacillus koleovorans TaxID=121608 RepID=UPI000FD844D5|nr:MarR family transcriptional regulator [Paenibacillus koleovorans]
MSEQWKINNREEQIIEITEMFRLFSKKWMAEWNKRKPEGISPTHAAILTLLESKGPQKPSSLAAELHITTGGVTGLTDKLVDAGYASRTRDDADRRLVYLEITEAGRELLKDITRVKRERETSIFSALNDEELNSYLQLLQKLCD